MSDDKTKRGKPDRIRINVHQIHELRYWLKALHATKDDLLALVNTHGPMVAAVKRAMIARIRKA